jgi:hypothetical protein
VKEYFYHVKKSENKYTPLNNLLITIELEEKTKITQDKRLKFKQFKGKKVI